MPLWRSRDIATPASPTPQPRTESRRAGRSDQLPSPTLTATRTGTKTGTIEGAARRAFRGQVVRPRARRTKYAGVAKLADARDLKSRDRQRSCGFDSRPRHSPYIVENRTRIPSLSSRVAVLRVPHPSSLQGRGLPTVQPFKEERPCGGQCFSQRYSLTRYLKRVAINRSALDDGSLA